MQLVRNGAEAELRHLDLQAKGLLWLRGQVQVDKNGRLSGTLDLGIEESLLALARSPAVSKVFIRPETGYRWAAIELSGTVRHPTDNLAQLMEKSRETPQQRVDPGLKLENEFEKLTQPQD